MRCLTHARDISHRSHTLSRFRSRIFLIPLLSCSRSYEARRPVETEPQLEIMFRPMLARYPVRVGPRAAALPSPRHTHRTSLLPNRALAQQRYLSQVPVQDCASSAIARPARFRPIVRDTFVLVDRTVSLGGKLLVYSILGLWLLSKVRKMSCLTFCIPAHKLEKAGLPMEVSARSLDRCRRNSLPANAITDRWQVSRKGRDPYRRTSDFASEG